MTPIDPVLGAAQLAGPAAENARLESRVERFNPLQFPIGLAIPARVRSSGWLQHTPFAMTLVDAIRPGVVVELGTHHGVSFCAFCQAVLTLGLNTRCYAIDTWEGDAQAGFYGREVLEDLRRHHETLYGGFSRLIQSTFDAALTHFEDGSIDLLHIDGFHSYEAVRRDFHHWLPKLNRSAVVLFHDTNVRERDFGVSQFFAEIRGAYPHFEFFHGHGLGLLAVGHRMPESLRALVESSADDANAIRTYFHRLGRQVEALLEAQDQRAQLVGQSSMVEQLQTQLRSLPAVDATELQRASSRPEATPTGIEVADPLRTALGELLSRQSEMITRQDEFREEREALRLAVAEQREQMQQLTAEVSSSARREEATFLALEKSERSAAREVMLRQAVSSMEKQVAGCNQRIESLELAVREAEESKRQLSEEKNRLSAQNLQQACIEEGLKAQIAQLENRFASLASTAMSISGRLRGLVPQSGSTPTTANPQLHYLEAVPRFVSAVRAATPETSVVAVVSKGDEQLLGPGDRTWWHFPRDPLGRYAGHYPADSAAAVRHLETLRSSGAEYLAFPPSARWWLDHYAGLRQHLESIGNVVVQDDSAVVFQLCAASESTGLRAVNPSVADAEAAMAQVDAEMVAAATRQPLFEADVRREAMHALSVARLRGFLAGTGRMKFPKLSRPTLSVVIPTFNQAHHTFAALSSLLAVVGEVPLEVVIVDNNSRDELPALFDRLENVKVQRNPTNEGFGAACNAGAKLSSGRYVCFLNSDAIVTPGALAAMIARLDADATCGAVGAKLVHPSGLLQEAGSILWRDGSALGYGRGDDPSRPEYAYAREVDYCSAACLVVRRATFLKVGGYDDRYSPAYYEDSDLCLAIRAAGLKVIYEPMATVIHMEFGSSDSRRAVELQERNRGKLVAKWQTALVKQLAPDAANVVIARDRRPGKRVLVIDDQVPTAVAGSGFLRSLAMLHALADSGLVVTFIPVSDRRPHEPGTGDLQRAGIEVLHGRSDLSAAILGRAGVYDAVIVSRPHNARLMPLVRQANPRAAMIYDAEAVYAVREILEAAVRGTPLSEADAADRVRREVAHTHGCDLVLTVSESERRAILRHNPAVHVEVWGDSIKPSPGPDDFRARSGLLFVGNLATPPNADALLLLLREVFPRFRKKCPTANLTVVGSSPPAAVFDASIDLQGVLLAGFIPQLQPVYDRARVFVATHRFAAGQPRKVTEAMAHGVPCVLSPLLAEQLSVRDGREVLIGRTAAEIATKAATLHSDARLWRRLRRAGLEYVARHYDPPTMHDRIVSFLNDAMKSRAVASD